MQAVRWAGFGGLILLLGGAAWGVGFAVFDRAAREPAEPAPKSDAIVALTGGAERVDTALGLLIVGKAPLLLISGVARGTDLAELDRHGRLSPEQAERVTLGRSALTTLGNAEETATWARSHGVRSLLVVTAGYHMWRALLEIGRALPGVALYPVPVRPPALRGGLEMSTLRIMANEYDKYLVVLLGVSRRPEPVGR